VGLPHSTPPSLPEKDLLGGFKNTEQTKVTHKIYRLTGDIDPQSEDAPPCKPETVECAKEVLKWLRGRGIHAGFVAEFPDRFMVRISDGGLLEWFPKSFSEIKPRGVEEVVGFDEGGLLYRFGDMGQSGVPYDVLRYEPYRCPALRRLSIEVYYERREYWDALEALFNSHVGRSLREFMELVPKGLKDVSDLEGGDVRLALLSGETLERRTKEIAEMKSRSYNGLSTLQLINGDKLLGAVGGQGEEYYVANLVSGLLFKAGCIPYYVELPTQALRVHPEYLKLPRALYVGVGLRKVGEEYAKGLAVLMTGRGNVVGYVDKNFHIRGRSMEFLDDKEPEEFVNEIKAKLESYRSNMREDPELIVVVRSRRFHEMEWRTLRRNFARHWLRLSPRELLLMSTFKFKKVRIGPGRAVEVGRTLMSGGLRGVWLLQLRKFKSTVKVSYFYTRDDANLPLAAYIYLRSLDFTSLTLNRTSLPPVKYARNYLRWRYPS